MAGSQMQLEDWLDDLCVRFIINLPEEDLSSVARLCFQVEEAQWFYEDFIRPLDPSLPSMSLRTFCLRIFQHCPLLASFSVENHTRAFEEFLQYKTRVPVRGAILLNHDMDATVLVKGWKKGANWSFPRGKINKDEDDLDCAVREVWEETGLDLRAAGLVPTEAKPKYIEITMREQQMRLYVFRDVPMDTNFQPQTRKEISKIQWYRLSELPAFRKKATQAQNQSEASSNANKFYMVAPFLVPLKKWVVSQKKTEAKKSAAIGNKNLNPHYSFDEGPTEDDTWPHAAATLPVHDPGLHTLQDATNELQRLLKVQPPTQGLQPPRSQEDKASALLSMLQLKDPSASQQQSQQLQQQLPLPSNQHAVSQPVPELTTGNVPQTRIPLYYTHRTRETEEKSKHQAADLLLQQTRHPNLHPHTSSHNQHQMESWNTNQVQMRPNFIQAGPQEFDGASSSYSRSHPAQLLHPQPLPPQVQRGMFSKNSFQESHQAAPAPSALPSGLQAQQHQQIQEQQLRSHSHSSALPPGETGYTEGPRPVRLDGQSMALLNAFKRDTGISPSAQPLQLQTGPQQDYDTQPIHSTQQRYGYQIQAQPLELAGSVGPKSHVASTKAEPLAHTNQHRSALLGMFSRQQVDSETNDRKAAPSAVQPQGSRELYSLGHDRFAQVNPDPVASQGTPSSNTGAALSDFLALKPRADQPAAATREVGFNATYDIGQPSGTQPIRLLQRGQDAEAVGGLGSQPERPERPEPSSPYLQQSHRGPETFTSPSMSVSQPSPGESQRRPDAAHDQKRQLLSLFGKQQQQQQQLPGHQGQQSTQAFAQPAGEGASSQGSPSRAGNGTPMSPAEQTFLLGYLQSVTNTASR